MPLMKPVSLERKRASLAALQFQEALWELRTVPCAEMKTLSAGSPIELEQILRGKVDLDFVILTFRGRGMGYYL